ncbi:MAG: hypothetical protein R3A78_08670 [Polyangiales bacterium]
MGRTSFAIRVPWALLAIGLGTAGCSLLASTDSGELTNPDRDTVDAGTDAQTFECAGGCDDGVDCTTDVCVAQDQCEHNPTHSVCADDQLCDRVEGCVVKTCSSNDDCDDGLFCDGQEICDPTADGASPFTGCAPGVAPNCDDAANCTVDSCDENGNACRNRKRDGLCDDGVDCTSDTCDPASSQADEDGCLHAETNAACQSTCFPNATCSVGAGGCVMGTPLVCTTNDACVVASCSEEAQMCVESQLDEDGDGASPESCGGDDCDDTRATVHPGASEICGNSRDDDCDTDVDEGDCVTIPDSCTSAQAIQLSAGMGSVTGTLAPFSDDYDLDCQPNGAKGRDAVYFVDVNVLDHVEIDTVGSAADTVLGVRVGNSLASTCPSNWDICHDDISTTSDASRVWVGGYDGPVLGTQLRRIFILVEGKTSSETGSFKLTVRTSRGDGRTCGSGSHLDVSGGGLVVNTLSRRFNGDDKGSCQSGDKRYADAVAKFTAASTGHR